jgi:hypothetical protein
LPKNVEGILFQRLAVRGDDALERPREHTLEESGGNAAIAQQEHSRGAARTEAGRDAR